MSTQASTNPKPKAVPKTAPKSTPKKFIQREIKKIAVLTSGGDAPGMNACIRAVVRAALHHDMRVIGVTQGYKGLIMGADYFEEMKSEDVSNIIHRGGTILKSARCEEFKSDEGMQRAFRNLEAHGIDAVVAIGGDGTFTGAREFSGKFNIPFIGIPGTIDNDLANTDFTIGYDTALNTVIEAIDKIRDTANSHDRLFIIEVMGRDAGYIAIRTGIACGAEAIIVPEKENDIDELVTILEKGFLRKKTSSIIVVAEGYEGDNNQGTFKLSEEVKNKLSPHIQYDIRVTVLGHIQRGGAPTCKDRVLATRLGVAAVEGLISGQRNMMVGLIKRQVVFSSLENIRKDSGEVTKELLRLANIVG